VTIRSGMRGGVRVETRQVLGMGFAARYIDLRRIYCQTKKRIARVRKLFKERYQDGIVTRS
jgi:hypothetical protein